MRDIIDRSAGLGGRVIEAGALVSPVAVAKGAEVAVAVAPVAEAVKFVSAGALELETIFELVVMAGCLSSSSSARRTFTRVEPWKKRKPKNAAHTSKAT